MLSSYPKIKFLVNKKKELETYIGFLHDSKFHENKREMDWAFYIPHPKLMRLRNKKFSSRDKIKIVKKYIDEYYCEKDSKAVKRILLVTEKQWTKKENLFFALVNNIFHHHPWPKGKYIAYGTIWGMYPRFLKDKTFLFPLDRKNKREASIIIAHEMLHFIFYDYVFNKFQKYKKHEYDFKMWHISEIFNVIIQNSPEWVKFFGQKTDPYPEHRRHIRKLKKAWINTNNVDEWFLTATKYLENQIL